MSATVVRDERSAIIDQVMDVYLAWREACMTVQTAYDRWCASAKAKQMLAHAAYLAALEQEEHAAACYQRDLDRVAVELTR